MGFQASEAVEPLDYDLTPHVDAKGTVPEPTEAGLRKFQAQMARRLKDLGIDPQTAADRRQLGSALAALDEQKAEKAAEQMLGALATLCQGSPSREQLDQLPPRVRGAFMGWLVGLLFGTVENPTSPSPGIRGSLATANGAAAAG